MVTIISDSTCDLSPDLVSKFKIPIVPLSVFIDGQNFLDGIEITSSQLFDLVEKTKELPKTSAPSIESFHNIFEKYDEMVYIGISSQLSASYQSCLIALEGSDPHSKIAIDSLNLSTGIGLLVLKAAELSHQGRSASQIAEQIKKAIPKVKTSFVIDTLEYIYKGGRCSAIELMAASLLKIRPVIEVRPDGTLGVREKLGGSRKKALLSLISNLETQKLQIDSRRVFITHCACSEDAAFIKTEIERMSLFEEILITEAGSTIASHCGPKTIGILYMTK